MLRFKMRMKAQDKRIVYKKIHYEIWKQHLYTNNVVI